MLGCLNQHSIVQARKGMITVPSLSSLVCLNCGWTPGKGRGYPCLVPVTGKGCKAGPWECKRSHLHPLSMAAGWGHWKDWATAQKEMKQLICLIKGKQEQFIWHRRSIQHPSSYALTALTVCLTFISSKRYLGKKEKLHLICWMTPRQKHCWGNSTNTIAFSPLSSV